VAATIAAALAPICILAAPSLASANSVGSGLAFADDASGDTAALQSPSQYVSAGDSPDAVGVYFTGANATEPIDLCTDDGGDIQVASGTADANGNGTIAWTDTIPTPTTVSDDGADIWLVDAVVGCAVGPGPGTTPSTTYEDSTDLNDNGSAFDVNGDTVAGTELFMDYAGAQGDTVQLYVDGALQDTETDDNGIVNLTATNLAPGVHTAYTTDNGSAQGLLTFVVSPALVGVSYYQAAFSVTDTPTVTLDNVNSSNAVNVYDDANGNPTQLPTSDYTVTQLAGNTAQLTFDSGALINGDNYAFTQQSGGFESSSIADSQNINIVSDVPSPYTTDESSPYFPLTADNDPYFWDQNNNTAEQSLGIEYTLTPQDGGTPITSGVLPPATQWQPSSPLADGSYTLIERYIDSFGALSAASPEVNLQVVTHVATPTFGSPGNGATIATATPTVTVDAPTGDYVVLCETNDYCDETQADGNGVASFQIGDFTEAGGGTTALTSGQNMLSATAYDNLGNQSDTATLSLNVSLPSTPGPPPPPTPTPTPAPPAATQPTTKQVTSSLTSALGTLKGKDATTAAIIKAGGATLTFKAPSAGTVTIKWYATVKGKKVLIGSATKTVGAGSTAKIKVKLDAAGKKLLKASKGSVKITQSGGFKPKGGKQSTSTKKLSLKG
jgi:hypothetical protein